MALPITDFDLFKAQCRVPAEIDLDDAILWQSLEAAEEWVFGRTGLDIEEYREAGSCGLNAYGNPVKSVPADLRQAILAMGAHFFAHPEAAENVNLYCVPYLVESIISRHWVFRDPATEKGARS